jgi:hypothetical protein
MYIFGIDLPVMEILFIFALLFLAALIVVWLEIRKLSRLIKEEGTDITRFEKDIDKLEGKKKKKS